MIVAHPLPNNEPVFADNNSLRQRTKPKNRYYGASKMLQVSCLSVCLSVGAGNARSNDRVVQSISVLPFPISDVTLHARMTP